MSKEAGPRPSPSGSKHLKTHLPQTEGASFHVPSVGWMLCPCKRHTTSPMEPMLIPTSKRHRFKRHHKPVDFSIISLQSSPFILIPLNHPHHLGNLRPTSGGREWPPLFSFEWQNMAETNALMATSVSCIDSDIQRPQGMSHSRIDP